MTEQCHDCGRFLAFADLCFSKFHFVPLNEFGPEEAWWSCPSCRDDYGGRDSGSGPKGENSRSEVEGEAPQSGLSASEGIAQTPSVSKEPPHDID